MRVRTMPANEVRIPEPKPGEIVVVERYGKPYAIVLDASQMHLVHMMLTTLGEHVPSELLLSDFEIEFHRMSERGEDIEEFDFSLLDTHPFE
jgi:hypothetical protein